MRERTVRLVKEVGGDGMFVKTDVANEDDVRSLVEKTVKHTIDWIMHLIMLG